MPEKKKNNGKRVWIIVLILSLMLISIAVGVAIWVYFGNNDDYSEYIRDATSLPTEPSQAEPTEPSEMSASTQMQSEGITEDTEASEEQEQPTIEPTQEILPDNPVDFEGLQALNSDIYAWIYIPNTGIDLPIFQAAQPKDDNYYMHRDVNGNYAYKGCIYTQRANSKDFSDPVTVIYGHHMYDGTMFSNLHYFLDDQFFEDNRYFYIYTPGQIMIYEIVSAFQYDERHILNSFDFSKEEIFQEYIDYILKPRTMVADVRDGVSVTTQDKIVTLSTCINSGTARYLVQGVLRDVERTT